MRRLRRIAAVFAALALGLLAWFILMLCWPTEGELRLGRELSSGRLIARVAPPRNPFYGVVFYGAPHLGARYFKPGENLSGALPAGTVSEVGTRGREKLWWIQLDPLDKSWEIEVREIRPLFLALAGKQWRIGMKTRVWKTRRVPAEMQKSD